MLVGLRLEKPHHQIIRHRDQADRACQQQTAPPRTPQMTQYSPSIISKRPTTYRYAFLVHMKPHRCDVSKEPEIWSYLASS